MSKLQVINDPKEFLNAISNPSEDLFLLKEDIFEPTDDILDKIWNTHKKYKAQSIYTDIVIGDGDIKSVQYYSDIESPNMDRIIFSPIACGYFKGHSLKIYPNLKYQSFSLLKQLCRSFFPWHIPQVGFNLNITQQEFHTIMQECQWVLQNAI